MAEMAGEAPTRTLSRRPVVVLLVDDQPVVARAMQDMLRGESDIEIHFCHDPLKAISFANCIGPTVILQDLSMPALGGLPLLARFRSNPATRATPVIVLTANGQPDMKSRAFALGATDYLVKLPHRLELAARLRHHSRAYVANLQSDSAYRTLAENERRLVSQFAEAAHQVRSLLPDPICCGPVRVSWRFLPSTQLSGDGFGYQWLDDRYFAMYLLDVSGHGVGAAMVAASVLTTLSSRSRSGTDFADPHAVLSELNRVFSFGRNGARFLTIWYGVYEIDTRILTFSGGGHPPALLVDRRPRATEPRVLKSSGPPIGLDECASFASETVEVAHSERLVLYSDGVVEVRSTAGSVSDQEAFTEFVTRTAGHRNQLDLLLDRAQSNPASVRDDRSVLIADFR